jgi:hypothetical protein
MEANRCALSRFEYVADRAIIVSDLPRRLQASPVVDISARLWRGVRSAASFRNHPVEQFQGRMMSVVTDKIGKPFGYGRGRRVSVERDGADFVVAFQPEGHIIFRHHDLKALRLVCSKLRWEVMEEKSFPQNLEDIRTYLIGSEWSGAIPGLPEAVWR